ncbi:hypothetical protein Tco_0693769 [Tanacetum coccineum]
MKMEILLEPTLNKLLWVLNLVVHSLRALSTLRRSGLRTASAAAKPCQGDSSEFYLITGRLPDAKFVRDFKSLAKEADESLAKHKALEYEIEYVLRAVFSQDIMSIVQNPTVVETSDLQTELERMKERFENYIIKMKNEYAKLWNDWYKKCEECKCDKILIDKAYNNMQNQIERLKAQLGDLKGKSKDTPCVSDTLDPLSQKLEDENVELGFQVLNYAKENAHLKTTYKNLINHFKTSREEKIMSVNKVRASVRTNPVTVSQPNVITKYDVNSNSNGLSSTGVDNTAKTRQPQPRSNTKNDRVPSASKCSCIENKEVKVEEHHRNLLLSKNIKHLSYECNNIKLDIRNDKSEVVCAMCKQYLITANHDVCVLKFAPQLHESAGGLLKTKLVSHSCSLAGSTSAIEVSIPIAFVLPGREHECNESFKLGRSPALS